MLKRKLSTKEAFQFSEDNLLNNKRMQVFNRAKKVLLGSFC